MTELHQHCPAKINAFLCVHGKRDDCFHALSSLVLPLAFGDDLWLSESSDGRDSLDCNLAELCEPAENLVIRAASAFRDACPKAPNFHFRLEKRIPVGAGLGGGSSNASAALLLMNRFCGEPLSAGTLHTLAAGLGSDCPLFLKNRPLFMSGRGEALAPVPDAAGEALTGRPLLLFKPGFSINTAWAYGALAKARAYTSESLAAELSAQWSQHQPGQSPGQRWLHNDFEKVILPKFLALELTLRELRENLRIPALLSGSGSACFCLPEDASAAARAAEAVKSMLGNSVFCIATCIIRGKTPDYADVFSQSRPTIPNVSLTPTRPRRNAAAPGCRSGKIP